MIIKKVKISARGHQGDFSVTGFDEKLHDDLASVFKKYGDFPVLVFLFTFSKVLVYAPALRRYISEEGSRP